MTTEDGRKYRLGLDLGTNSVGWAAVLLNEDGEPCGTLDMGVRIFPDGRNRQSGTSNAADRRVARGARRRRDRYLKRRGDLMQALVELGLMPPDERERKALERLDPYALRARALDHPLEPYELGRALFHLNQRRGFKSNRKTVTDDESEAKKTLAMISALHNRIEESGARTLGEFLAPRREKGESVRARQGLDLYPDRAMYEDEFDKIREAQEPHHSLIEERWDTLRDHIIFFQRPLKHVDPGWCQLEEGECRAAKALPVAQEFRMLQEVNNLRLRVSFGPERALDERERERALKRLRAGKDIKLREGKDNRAVKPTRDLGIPSGATFNLAAGGRKKIDGDKTAARLIKGKRRKGEKELTLFGDRWLDLPLDERNGIVQFMLDTEDPEVVRQKALDDWGLDAAQAEVVAHAALPDGYGNLSEKAIRKLLPHLEKGRVYSDAVKAAGYSHHSDFRSAEAHERLPYYGKVLTQATVGTDPTKDSEKDGEAARYGRFPNPTVHIGLNQLRRVVNRLIDAYGRPEDVVVELGRDLKRNREQKQNYERQQREGGKRNERFKEMLESAERPITADALGKLRLWEEQGRHCPYTGRVLSFEMAVSDATEIDHILPFSRTLDNSMANKVVCVSSANRGKGNRSPHEAFGHGQDGYDYDAILSRAFRLPGNKRWRFDEDAMDRFKGERHFLDRQLNETRYLSRTARAYLAHLYDERSEGKKRVRVIPGQMTALLRRGWRLEEMLPVNEAGKIVGKQRDDHRHHAIDAFVVANTTQGLLQRFAHAAGSDRAEAEERLAAVAGEARPWDGFNRSQLKPFLDRLVVSHKPDHGTRGEKGKTTGQLHNETAYGLIEHSEDGPSRVVTRKNLSDFKKRADIKSVRDQALRAALLELWDEAESEGGSVSKVTARFADRAANRGVTMGGRPRPVRRVRVVDNQSVIPVRDRDGRPYKGYLPGGNEFADVWRMRDGSWRMVVVPAFDANQPGFDIEQFRPKDKPGRRDPVAKRIMRLQIDDMGAFGEGPDRRIVRVRKITNAKNGTFVALDDHTEANVDARVRKKEMKASQYSDRQLQSQGFRKVKVNEIGRVLDPGPLAS